MFEPSQKVNLKEVIDRPLPRWSEDNERYLRNSRDEQRIINHLVSEAAMGQFISLIQSKAKDREDRVVELADCEPEATPTEILEASSFHSGDPRN
ncbi:hypothetical protein [Acaryochloris sp. CCMEE 5410]|uniref:hypothetical protein n=1 Tax=Acaryochloris sp. CCMEE 5410 TaxID=310037 RepID=UPI0002484D09|nr:hypothetical protein [Acaryochloris sp. CCMEE 5410]KAI9129087.1 hypothetical protein ON05_036645 [Acaryochloris sp. CCMEE 5410]